MLVPVSRMSPFSGNWNTMMVEMTKGQMDRYLAGGELIQNIFPDLSAELREFIKTGITPQEWEQTFMCEDYIGEEDLGD